MTGPSVHRMPVTPVEETTMRLFCFGTLLDPDVRHIVFGRPVPDSLARTAELRGYRRVRVPDEAYPAAVPDPQGVVPGVVIERVSPVERDRVQFFEGIEFALEERGVHLDDTTVVPALVCLSTPRLGAATTDPWLLEDWRRLHKPAFLKASRIYMAEFERMDAEEAHAVWLTHRG